ncbi:MAG: HAMP domain-containing histidine kinase [Candidatus Omnitrophica bacterium]|nr:HAMP domain-containing histidine kinase [Candidatus Omnitrophota bacterium]
MEDNKNPGAGNNLKDTRDKIVLAERIGLISELAGGISHEIRNILGSVLMEAEYLEKVVPAVNENVPPILKDIKDSALKVETIITQLADYFDMLRLNIEEDSINPVLRDALDLVMHQLDKKHIQVAVDFKEDLPPMRIDKKKIKQIFVHIFMHAIGFVPDGGKINLRTYIKEKAGKKEAVIEIEDNGTGIPQDLDGKLFDAFSVLKRKDLSLGMGLLIVKNVIEMHGGSIEICNKEGGSGSRASVRFDI